MVDSGQVPIMHSCILAVKHWRWAGKILHETMLLWCCLAGNGRTLWKPPEEGDAEGDAAKAPDEEHPLEAYESFLAVHLLEPCRDKSYYSSGKLRGSVIHANPSSGPSWWVEEREIVRHSWPHTGCDNAEEETQEEERPSCFDGCETGTNQSNCEDNTGHPDARTEARHDEVGREVKDDIGDVKESESERHLGPGQVEDGFEIVTNIRVHGLGEADIGADCGAGEVEDPECWDFVNRLFM